MTLVEIRSSIELPARREQFTLHTSDGQELVAELALPVSERPVATLICLHPLPTHGGYMDSHIMRKAANRLPALASVAVLRFNTRGTGSPQGTSTGSFDGGVSEKHDLEAAVAWAKERGLPNLWLLGWSFGTELALKYGVNQPIEGAILLSPPLHRANQADLMAWNGVAKRVVGLIPEFDDYLQPEAARVAFASMPKFEQVDVAGAKHLWVGEDATTRVLNEIVRVVAPQSYPLPVVYNLPN
ncbi:MAG: alpha/beta hydrolase [Micrococcales bacterium]